MFRRIKCLAGFLLFLPGILSAQKNSFTHADTLHGMLSPLRSCYDVTFYDLHLKIDTKRKSIAGFNGIQYRVVNDFIRMQIDLFSNYKIDSIKQASQKLKFTRDGNAVFINFSDTQKGGDIKRIDVFYRGIPRFAVNAPWDGGFDWKTDANGKTWLGVACEGVGASIWYPCKDHLSDKPDSASMTFTVPANLFCVSNGRLRSQRMNKDSTETWNWFVSYPVNTYDITLNLADYIHFRDFYLSGGKDTLWLNYYVLRDNYAKAYSQFKQVKNMLACYEKYFGPYPFLRDGYALCETNYWGMENQSCIGYGNNYVNNSFGFDFIIIHESAHEWWGNSVTCSDLADMWIHEAFATYAEALYVECMQNADASIKYLKSIQWRISDKRPVIGPYNVNYQSPENDDDMYFKGAWMIHTFRHVLNNDSLFFSILSGMQEHFHYESICTDSVIQFINKKTGIDYSAFFDQYLKDTLPPVLHYSLQKKGKNSGITCYWKTNEANFSMPVEVGFAVSTNMSPFQKAIIWQRIYPGSSPQTFTLSGNDIDDFVVNKDLFYIKIVRDK